MDDARDKKKKVHLTAVARRSPGLEAGRYLYNRVFGSSSSFFSINLCF